jgi:phenylacetate-coenzyme A ligase PaaK-like adenylate-forming protein
MCVTCERKGIPLQHLTYVPEMREAHCAEKIERDLDFKQFELYELSELHMFLCKYEDRGIK